MVINELNLFGQDQLQSQGKIQLISDERPLLLIPTILFCSYPRPFMWNWLNSPHPLCQFCLYFIPSLVEFYFQTWLFSATVVFFFNGVSFNSMAIFIPFREIWACNKILFITFSKQISWTTFGKQREYIKDVFLVGAFKNRTLSDLKMQCRFFFQRSCSSRGVRTTT